MKRGQTGPWHSSREESHALSGRMKRYKLSRGRVSTEVSEALKGRLSRGIGWRPSPHFGEREGPVDALVLHYTVTGSVGETVKLFRKVDQGTSIHYIIGKGGKIVQMVDLDKKAWHAGPSMFHGKRDANDFSIGVEIVNWGLLKEEGGLFFVWPGTYQTPYQGPPPVNVDGGWWEPFTEMQYRVLAALITEIRAHYPAITSERIVGHADIALPRGRKIDPGSAFDWGRIKDV
jgi:N-acetylmuramoyl-L-alanine amidase